MRACLVFLCLLAATFGHSIKSKPHGKHHGLHKSSHTAKEKDMITEEANNPLILPTLLPFEGISREQADGEMIAEDNANANKAVGELEVTEKSDKSPAVLLSDDDLVELLKEETDEEKEAEERVLAEEEKQDKGKARSGEIIEEEEAEVEEKTVDDSVDFEHDASAVKGEEEETALGRMPLKVKEEQVGLLEDNGGSTELEIPVDLDYAADSGIFQPIQFASAKNDNQPLSISDAVDEEAGEKGLPTNAEDYEQNRQNSEAVGGKKMQSDVRSKERSPDKKEPKEDVAAKESVSSAESESVSQVARKEERRNRNDNGGFSKGKTRKQNKNLRARKHSPQSEGPQSGQELDQEQDRQESEGSNTDSTDPKAKRRRAGKWGPSVGMNPVQIRATVDLYPNSRPSVVGVVDHPDATADPCDNFPCKRGKVCKLDADNKPGCVCQAPSECPPSVNGYDHVCGTDNKTYDTSCELFATKCNLEGSKRGHRLHLDYTGPCKLIPACVDTELIQFPLRMRDWLKNVLLQLYDHDSASPGFLTPKQRFRVKKIFENERRLHAGDHSVELLAQDFEKNYNMYIYPVHWQFAQLDQHPSDRFLSHSELAPLRVPLVPMEHCTSRFFLECDADKDKQVSFREWTSCFGIKTEDMDVNQLF